MSLMNKWDNRWMNLAENECAKWSKDRNTKVGCVIVKPNGKHIANTGYNDFPPGVVDDIEERRQRPEKYFWTEHAERAAIYQAARYMGGLEGCCLYTTLYPCADCARGIISSGIVRVVVKNKPEKRDKWSKDWDVASQMFLEAGILVEYLEE